MSIFPTNLGWIGLAGRNGKLLAVLVGHRSADEVRRQAGDRLARLGEDASFVESDWAPRLRERVVAYASGRPVDFDDICLESPAGTPFQVRVLRIARRIPFGKTVTYGELAERAGYPRAARAVGSVMASNEFPIVIPCHRVVAAGGKLGGYTSPRGVSLKEQLLELERESVR